MFKISIIYLIHFYEIIGKITTLNPYLKNWVLIILIHPHSELPAAGVIFPPLTLRAVLIPNTLYYICIVQTANQVNS